LLGNWILIIVISMMYYYYVIVVLAFNAIFAASKLHKIILIGTN
jgi:hypothetical protein